ncbi:MAG: protein kinase, partial [Cystobacterineae bacterium]|nr:protein kinase [Cystobacterineae bacterium]
MENALLPEMMPPREVLEGRYRFRTPLRSAGIGKLDCVEDVQTGQRRVVHWLPLEVNRYNQQNIVHLCAALPHHPCLPEVCEVGEMESWAFMVVDFPEGELLSARRELLKPETWRKMACQLASTLNVLHAQHIFHGELSMASIMVVGPEQYLLWDMPLVLSGRMADRRQEDRLLSQLTRTVSTMAPERARGGLLAPELDVYSLGAVLAYSVGSQQPTSSSVLTIVNAIAMGNFKPQLPNILPPAYRNMLERMLAPRASDRPSMHDVEAFFMRPPSLGPAPQLPSAGMPRVATPMMGQPVLYPMQPTPAPFPAPPLPRQKPPPPPPPLPPSGQTPPGSPRQTPPGRPAP